MRRRRRPIEPEALSDLGEFIIALQSAEFGESDVEPLVWAGTDQGVQLLRQWPPSRVLALLKVIVR